MVSPLYLCSVRPPALRGFIEEGAMDYKLEVVVVPVSDVDRAKIFYSEQCGFNVDLDDTNGGMRIVQLTPRDRPARSRSAPGSRPRSRARIRACSSSSRTSRRLAPELTGRADGPIRHFENGQWLDGKGGPWNSFASFDDPTATAGSCRRRRTGRPTRGRASGRTARQG